MSQAETILETDDYKQIHGLFEAALVAAMEFFNGQKRAWGVERAELKLQIEMLTDRLLVSDKALAEARDSARDQGGDPSEP